MSPRRSPSAFTLLELLVSMVVLVLLITSVVAMVDSVSQTTTADRRHLEADNEARRVFDRMAYDFAKMYKRADADTVFASIKGTDSTHGANDKMFFYSDAPAYYDATGQPSPTPTQSTTGLIGYRIHNEAANSTPAPPPDLQLERLGKGLTWDMATATSTPGAVVFLTYAASPSPTPPFSGSTFAGVYGTPNPAAGPGYWTGTGGAWSGAIGSVPSSTAGTATNNGDDGVDADYHVLSNYVFRLEYCFVLKNPTTTSQFVTSITQGQGFSNVSAIVVAIALLDAKGRSQMPATVSMNTLAAALPDSDFTTNPPGKLMLETWNAKIKNTGFAASVGIPQSVASQIWVYQRYFYLNTP